MLESYGLAICSFRTLIALTNLDDLPEPVVMILDVTENIEASLYSFRAIIESDFATLMSSDLHFVNGWVTMFEKKDNHLKFFKIEYI